MTNVIPETTSKSSNRWLIWFLLITVIVTVWTALTDSSATEETAEDLLVNKPLGAASNVSVSAHQKEGRNQSLGNQSADNLSGTDKLIPWQNLKREPIQEKTYDLFKVESWIVVPPVKKTKSQPPPPPVAPAVPFTYMGKLEGASDGTQVFLMANGKLYTVSKGEKVNQQWQLEAEDANTLRFTYLPLNLVQTLSKSAKLAVVSEPAQLATTEFNQ